MNEAPAAAIPLAVPRMSGREREYIEECLATNWVSYAGPFVSRFERQLTEATGCAEAVAVTSGTAALHVALILAGVEPESEVVMPGISFVAAANAVRYTGAWPSFLDIEAAAWQLAPRSLRAFLETRCRRAGGGLVNKVTGRRISAVLLVHLLGGLADSAGVAKVCAEFDLPLVEDAAECLGGRYEDRLLAAPLEDLPANRRLMITSFNGNKIITTGGGGALLLNDGEQAARARHLTTTAKTDAVAFVHDELGYNYRLTNMAAAMGVAQLEVLHAYVEDKRRTAARYAEALGGLPGLVLHPQRSGSFNTYWLYTVMLDRPSRPVIDEMIRLGIQCRPVWQPLPDLPHLAAAHSEPLTFGRRFHERAVSLPCSVGILHDDVQRVCETLAGLSDEGDGLQREDG